MLRSLAGQAMQIVDRHGTCAAVRRHRLDRRVQRGERHGHVGGVGGDAGLAAAEDRAACGQGRPAPRSRRRARVCCRAWRCRRSRRSGCAASGCRRWSPCCAAAPSRRRAAPGPAPDSRGARGASAATSLLSPSPRCAGRRRPSLDLAERQAADVDQVRGPLDLQLHQVEQVGAAGQEPRAGRARRRPWRPRRRSLRALVGERPHAPAPPHRGSRRGSADRPSSGRCCRSSARGFRRR